MLLADQYAAEWAGYLRTVSDADLLNTTRDYIWLAEFGPVEGRGTFSLKRDGVVNEMRARDMDGQLEALRRELGAIRLQRAAVDGWRSRSTASRRSFAAKGLPRKGTLSARLPVSVQPDIRRMADEGESSLIWPASSGPHNSGITTSDTTTSNPPRIVTSSSA
jgi:hypothetical protein